MWESGRGWGIERIPLFNDKFCHPNSQTTQFLKGNTLHHFQPRSLSLGQGCLLNSNHAGIMQNLVHKKAEQFFLVRTNDGHLLEKEPSWTRGGSSAKKRYNLEGVAVWEEETVPVWVGVGVEEGEMVRLVEQVGL
jgi:hypothetical protein